MSTPFQNEFVIDEVVNRSENVAQPNKFNVLNRPAWIAPKRVEMRPGSFDYMSWPSKGGD